jgi:predicted enzyme related to lactoylglutathione lyase
MVNGLAGVTIWTGDLERLVGFYRDILGLELHRHHGDFANFVWGNVRLNLGLHDRVTGPSRDPYRIMVHLDVADIHEQYRRLSGRGVEFIRAPEKEGWGGWVATFLDPDGNVLQLLQQPDP